MVWTLVPILVCPNLQLDLAEDLALGKEWQLGYWKHPPLPWWVADFVYRLTGQIESVYVLGPLAAVLCFYAVWLLGRDIIGSFRALLRGPRSGGRAFYNFSAVKFAHDQMQLPFWGFTGLFFYRAVGATDCPTGALPGVLLAGAFWSKYAAFPLAATLGLVPAARSVGANGMAHAPGPSHGVRFRLCDRPERLVARRDTISCRSPYVDARRKEARHWYEYLGYPLEWTGTQVFFLLPAIGMLALLYAGRGRPSSGSGRSSSTADHRAFDRRYMTALALGPFAITTLVAAVLGRLPVAMWGYPLWSFAPLAALIWLGPVEDRRRLRPSRRRAWPCWSPFRSSMWRSNSLEPLVRQPSESIPVPRRRDGRNHHARLARRASARRSPMCAAANSPPTMWRSIRRTGPMCWFAATPSSPLGSTSPICAAAACGGHMGGRSCRCDQLVDQWRDMFGDFEIQPALVFERQTFNPVPTRVFRAYVPPQP